MYDHTSQLSRHLDALSHAVGHMRGRVDPQAIDRADAVLARADQRLAFAGSDTVVALAGATGSGKSSLFNAVSNTHIGEPGMKRPTTAHATAAYWGASLPDDLLDWLDISARHLVDVNEKRFDGLVLIDMPDHDSLIQSHRDQVDRLVGMVDMLIWVVDPQKYADARLHHDYLIELAHQADAMMVVLNQADRLSRDDLQAAMKDLRRLLDSEGLTQTPTIAVSALTGLGIEDLRATIAKSVANKAIVAARLDADVRAAADVLAKELPHAPESNALSAQTVRQFNRSLAEAAGVHTIEDAVYQSTRRRGYIATGWPLISWIQRIKSDPIRRLHLSPATAEASDSFIARTAVFSKTAASQAHIDAAVRPLLAQANAAVPQRWRERLHTIARSHRATLPDEIDQALATTDLGIERAHRWWTAVTIIQWLIAAALLIGLGWALVGALINSLPIPRAVQPYASGHISIPAVLIWGSILAGIVLGLASGLGVKLDARRAARQARTAVIKSIGARTCEGLISELNDELSGYSLSYKAVRSICESS